MNYPPKKHLYLIHKLRKAIHKYKSPDIESESKQQAPSQEGSSSSEYSMHVYQQYLLDEPGSP